MKSLVVYTAVFGGYDLLTEPRVTPDDVAFVCFTDNARLRSRKWRVVHVESGPLGPTAKNREVKMLAHKYFPDYEWSVYVDGNVHVIGDVRRLVAKYLSEHPVAASRHPARQCIYEEAEACIRFGKADQGTVRAQMERYARAGYPQDNGLTENNVLLRRHLDPHVIAAMEDWWNEFRSGAPRDQLSFGYVMWRQGLPYVAMEERLRSPNEYFHVARHLPKVQSSALRLLASSWVRLEAGALSSPFLRRSVPALRPMTYSGGN